MDDTMRDPGHNRGVMRRIVDVFMTGDLSDVDTLFASDYLDHQGVGQGPMVGPDGFRSVVDLMRSRYADLGVEIEDLISEGDMVLARLRWSGIPTTGDETVTRRTIEIMRFADGKAIEHWGQRLDGGRTDEAIASLKRLFAENVTFPDPTAIIREMRDSR